jgi:hypothetical protein
LRKNFFRSISIETIFALGDRRRARRMGEGLCARPATERRELGWEPKHLDPEEEIARLP